jgi:hypothetical protein
MGPNRFWLLTRWCFPFLQSIHKIQKLQYEPTFQSLKL